MTRVVVQHLRLAGPLEVTEALLEEVRAVAEQHPACRVEVATPFELELSLDGVPSPERLAAAAQHVATALDAAPPAAADTALALAEPVGLCAAALRREDRAELLDALTAVAVAAVQAVERLDGQADATPLARVLSAAAEVLPPEGPERAWVGRLVSDAAEAVRRLEDLDAPWAEVWVCSVALVDVAAAAVQALAHFGQDAPPPERGAPE